MERDLYHYIAWRSKAVYMACSCLMGGLPANSDDRLWNQAGAPFVLSIFREGATYNYAVADEDAESIIARIREHCGGECRRTYPFYQVSDNGPEAVTEINIDNEYYAFGDAALLKSWFEELESRCGAPMNERELYDYTHPAPPPVTGGVTVTRIIEQAVIPPQAPSLPVPPPDNCRSELVVEEGGAADRDAGCTEGGAADVSATLTVYCCRNRYKYDVPARLLPWVNEAARELLAHPVNGYHTEWDPAAWITIKERKEEFDVDPEGVLKLFEELVSKCAPADALPGPVGYRGIKDSNPVIMPSSGIDLMVSFAAPPAATPFTAPISAQPSSQPAQQAGDSWFCPVCGKQNSGGFCSECGSKRP